VHSRDELLGAVHAALCMSFLSGLGWGADTFISTYKDNRKEATQTLLEDSLVATVLIALARTGVSWSGKPQLLYEAIVKVTGHTLGPRRPKTISKFGSELRRIAPQLRAAWNLHNF
jgi:Na+-driven multidrug efflux pump